MAEIRALVIDNDPHFLELLRSSLLHHEVRIDVAANADDCLNQVASLRLDIVFISVETPDKSGFKLFSRVKGQSKVLPVVLVTSTIPLTEMTLHQKLKIHAEDYWDKRDLTPETIVARLAKIVPLSDRRPSGERDDDAEDVIVVEETELDELLSDISRAERSAAEKALMDQSLDTPNAQQERHMPRAPSPMRGLSLEELEALVAELADSSATSAAEVTPPTQREILESSLEREEISQLKNELEEARRIARASPFSQDFFRLLENVRDKEKEIFDLNVRLEARKRELASRTGTARQLAEQLLGALRLREHEQEIIATMEDDLGAIRAEIDRAREEQEALRRQQELEIKRLEANFALERERHADACRRYESTINEKESRHAEELRDEVQSRLATLEALEARLREEKNRAVENALERERQEHDERIQALKRNHEQQLAAHEREHEAARKSASEELAQIHTALEKRLEEIRLEHEARINQRAAEQAQALRVKEQEQKDALEAIERRLREERLRELEETRHQHIAELRELEARHTQALAEAERRHQSFVAEHEKQATREKIETLRASSAEWEGRLAQLRREHAKELADRDEEHERKLHDLQAQTTAQLNHEREQTAELRRVVDEMSAARGRLERQHHENRERLESKLAALEVRHAEALRESEQNRLSDLQTAEKRMAEEKSRTIAAAEAEWRQKEDQSQRERDAALQALRQEYEARLAAAEKSQRELRERGASELTALRLESTQLQKKLRAAESQHAEARRQADKQHESALEELQRRHAEALALLRREHEAALAAQETQLREIHERNGYELKSLRSESQELGDKLQRMQAEQSDGRRQAEVEREAALQALEALLTEKHAQALIKAEEQWRQKVDVANREKSELLMTVQREREQLDVKTAQAHGQTLAKKESEIKAVMTENARLEQQLTESKSVIAAHERTIESLRRESADQTQTIASLKAMIGDFTVAPSGPEQPVTKVVAAVKPESPKPVAAKTMPPKASVAKSSSPKAPPKTTSGSNRR